MLNSSIIENDQKPSNKHFNDIEMEDLSQDGNNGENLITQSLKAKTTSSIQISPSKS